MPFVATGNNLVSTILIGYTASKQILRSAGNALNTLIIDHGQICLRSSTYITKDG
jgi:hypothetical protein